MHLIVEEDSAVGFPWSFCEAHFGEQRSALGLQAAHLEAAAIGKISLK
jgi:hypothetical protein